MLPTQFRQANPVIFKMIAQATRHKLSLAGYEAVIRWDEQFIIIKDTNFAISWVGTEAQRFDCEVLTNYTKDGKYCPLRNSFAGFHEECVVKAIRTHEYFQKINAS